MYNLTIWPYFKEIQICLNSVYTHSHPRPKTLSSLDIKDAPWRKDSFCVRERDTFLGFFTRGIWTADPRVKGRDPNHYTMPNYSEITIGLVTFYFDSDLYLGLYFSLFSNTFQAGCFHIQTKNLSFLQKTKAIKFLKTIAEHLELWLYKHWTANAHTVSTRKGKMDNIQSMGIRQLQLRVPSRPTRWQGQAG